MRSKKRTSVMVKSPGRSAAAGGRRSDFGFIYQDDPYTSQIQGLLRKAKSGEEAEARPALLELFYRFHLRLPLEEARLSRTLPWNRQASQN